MAPLQIVLASNSPRRREIISWLGLPILTTSADVNEEPLPDEDPVEYVTRLAEEKARVCSREVPFNAVLLAADTTVADLGKIIGKPEDEDHARRILSQLRNRNHMVHTALVLSIPSKGIMLSDRCSTRVKMRSYTDEEIEAYIATGDALDKAGAYAIQHQGFQPVAKMEGCFASVMGLPLCHLERNLRKLGFGYRNDVPYRCQKELAYSCPIFKYVLAGDDIG